MFLQTTGLALLGLAGGATDLLAQSASVREIRYTVRRGDTLTVIAQKHGVSIESIKVRNKLRSDVIKVGQRLIIPTVAAPAPVPASLGSVIAATRNLTIRRGRWRHVVVHHSGIENGNAKAYDAGHRRRGMEHGLAYHFVIGNGLDSGDGQIEIGPRWHAQIHGGHVRSQAYNESGIGICLVGNFEKRPPGTKQLNALTTLIDWLRTDAPLGVKPAFTVHRWVDRNHTACPGRHFPYTEMKRRYRA